MAQSSYADRLKKATELATRATHLEASLSSLSPLQSPLPTLHKAFPLYISAAENYSHLISSGLAPEHDKANIKKKWRLVLERAEKVKRRIEDLGGHVGKVGVSDEVEEEAILHRGGVMNGVHLDMWTPGLIRYEGDIAQPELAEEQEELGPEWADVDPATWSISTSNEWVVRQGHGADCSVVAGFGACLEHNRRWGTSLGQDTLYPQNPSLRPVTPLRSDSGRHVVRLLLNGAWRSLVIDSLLPRSKLNKQPLHATSHPESVPSDNASIGPPWIPLILKGYFKAFGGYSLRGSNPAPDIYTLTGWIPERISLRDGFQREKEWKRIRDSWKRGEVIVTLGTGSTNSSVGSAGGLVPFHAYAVLGGSTAAAMIGRLTIDIKEGEDGERLLKVYDPGSYRQSVSDNSNDLPRRLETLDIRETETGEGMTYRSWDSICADFGTLNLNWNPNLLPIVAKRHWSWPKPLPEANETPPSLRYRLDVKMDRVPPNAEIWILLSQHICNKDRPLDDIALQVHEENSVRPGLGSRSISHEERIGVTSPYSNAVHVLYRHQIRRPHTTLTVLPLRDRGVYRTDFTLHAYAPSGSTVDLERVSTTYPFSTSLSGRLSSKTAGGRAGLASWVNNPQYKLDVSSPHTSSQRPTLGSRMTLQGDGSLAWNAKILRGNGDLVFEYGEEAIVADSGAYAYGVAFIEMPQLEPGVYTVSVSAYEPGQVGEYTLKLDSDLPVSLSPIPGEGAGMYGRTLSGMWSEDTSGGRPSGGAYDQNVRIEITLPRDCTIMARGLLPVRPNTPIPLNVTLFERGVGGRLGEQIATSGPYSDAVSGVSVPRTNVSLGVYILVLSAWEKGMGIGHKWESRVWTDAPLEVERVR
ncbi:calpain-like protease palB/RIM13 [Papiliotrema laurentii]|uniref:Calpain-like protease palB/RIM13 n=1 Tax=Papiliotrema laurentii TaxID=5418 RepID=A0AAD9CRN1_PAPLA|nr:calpain-like protease palB/RIM13 [Papiliotrema laurentii]